MLTVKEVANRINLSTRAVGNLCKTGEIEAHDVGTGKNAHYRISEEALESYLNRKKVVPLKQAEQRVVRQGGYRMLRMYGGDNG